ncbi:MAG: IS110 family transposase [Clostridiales bacterium]|nr:IS110 family transposase [Clostridiales bacterium]
MKEFFIGVDLHKNQFTVYMMNSNDEGTYTVFKTDEAGYKSFIGILEQSKQLGFKLNIAVESTGNTRYFRNRIESAGVIVKIINTMKFKVVNESINKTDKRDAKTIAEFLKKDVLPEAKLCSEESELLRRLVNVRSVMVSTKVKMKNQIHGILLGMSIKTKNGQLNSKKGRLQILDQLKATNNHKIIELLINNIEDIEKNIKKIEEEMEELTKEDRAVEILKSISGTGKISAITVRSQIDDIKRFDHYKKISSFAGLVPWVKCSDEKKYYGNITKRGPSELRVALVQMVLGMIRCKDEKDNILMIQYRNIKKRKGSGKALIALARKFTKLIWTLLTNDELYDKEKLSKEIYLEKIVSMQENQKLKDAA